MSTIDVIPGILEKEWEMIEERLRLVMGLVEWVQIEFADNTMVPNTTFLDFSRFSQPARHPYAQALAGGLSQPPQTPQLEAHLMVSQPEKYIKVAGRMPALSALLPTSKPMTPGCFLTR